MFTFESEEQLKKRINSKIDYSRPVICYFPDWRIKENIKTKEKYYCFMTKLLEFFLTAVEESGGSLLLLGPEDDFFAIQDKIDGFIIPGGRDMDPKLYNQENKGSKIEEDSKERFQKTLNIYMNMDFNIPVFCVCWGFQFLNVVHGGDLLQHLEKSDQHYKRRRMFLQKGSWIHKTVGDSILGSCYHHQGLGKIGKGLQITAVDDHCNEPHALEYIGDRWVQAILWHPEITYTDETGEERDSQNLQLFKSFVGKALERKKSKFK